ncbi:MAG: BrxA/BrxB family bacilliredoxin [Bacteroidetes bacterium]|jgi:putative YphP/YqiW family bacilliredoxin|nr:BrxA/BrxB family bacilliredoxin [Bacteroidota bacterium]
MYPPELVAPKKTELTEAGFSEMLTVDDVDAAIAQSGSTLIVINSVCGCAASSMRPGVLTALQHDKLPANLTTAFAGVDTEAVERVRKFLLPYPPSSPSIALFKDGRLMHMVERHHIEGRNADMIADHLKMVFDEHC